MEKPELRKEWENRIKEYQASGQSGAAWCKANNHKPHQLYYWLKKLTPEDNKPASAPKWLPVELSDYRVQQESNISIAVGQATIEVKPGFDPLLLQEIVKTLTAIC